MLMLLPWVQLWGDAYKWICAPFVQNINRAYLYSISIILLCCALWRNSNSDTPIAKISDPTLSQSPNNMARAQIQKRKRKINDLTWFGNLPMSSGQKGEKSYSTNRVTRVTKIIRRSNQRDYALGCRNLTNKLILELPIQLSNNQYLSRIQHLSI